MINVIALKNALIGDTTGRSHCVHCRQKYRPLGNKQVVTQIHLYDILLLTIVLGFALNSRNNKNIILILGYNYYN